MARPHAAAIVEDSWHRLLGGALQQRGWGMRIVSHTGYGSEDFVRVLGRVLLTRRPERHPGADAEAPMAELRAAEEEQRGWRAFLTVPAMDVPVTVEVAGQQFHTRSDRSGLIDASFKGVGLSPGWHDVRLVAAQAEPVEAAVRIVGRGETFGIVSDIDDTVISTSLPRPLIAAWNTFVRAESARHVVPGMAPLYRALLEDHPAAPIVYVSTGAWNTAPHLTRFLKKHGFPLGPLLLTDWGPTNTGWFRSGQEHKRSCLHRLAREFPDIRWLLVGDDGQHDPKIYGDFSEERPDRVDAIAIRELTPTEQVLSHGLPVSNEELTARPRYQGGVPTFRAPDGYGLLRLLRAWQAE